MAVDNWAACQHGSISDALGQGSGTHVNVLTVVVVVVADSVGRSWDGEGRAG
jgi:hypothetical protein